MTHAQVQRRRSQEDGSTVVEMSFVATVLFSLLFGMLAFAIVEAGDNAGTNAAREGARAAAINPLCADKGPGTSGTTDCPAVPSAQYTSVTTTVNRRLGGLVIGKPTVSVICLSGTAGTALNPVPCDTTLNPSVDLVRVAVTWTREATGPFTGPSTHTDTATMTVVSGGAVAPPANPCQLASSAITPTPPTVSIVGPGPTGLLDPAAANKVSVSVTTNGQCQTPIEVSYYYTDPTDGSDPQQQQPSPMIQSGNSFTHNVTADGHFWMPSVYTFVVQDGAGNLLSQPTPLLLTVTGAQCQFVSGSTAPPTAALAGTNPGQLAGSVSVSLTTTSGCQGITVSFSPGGSPQQTLAMSGSEPNYTLVLPSALSWSPGIKQFTFTDVAANQPLAGAVPVSLTVSQGCVISAFTASPNPDGKRGNNNLESDVTVTATQAAGATCSNLSLTYTYQGGQTGPVPMVHNGTTWTFTINKNSGSWAVGSWPMTLTSTSGTVSAPALSLKVTAD